MIKVHEADTGVEHVLSESQIAEVVESAGWNHKASITRVVPVGDRRVLRTRESVAEILLQIEREREIRRPTASYCSCVMCSRVD